MVLPPRVLWLSILGNITPIDDLTGIYVAPIACFTKKITGWDLYNTLVAIKAYDSGPVVERLVPKMFSVSTQLASCLLVLPLCFRNETAKLIGANLVAY